MARLSGFVLQLPFDFLLLPIDGKKSPGLRCRSKPVSPSAAGVETGWRFDRYLGDLLPFFYIDNV